MNKMKLFVFALMLTLVSNQLFGQDRFARSIILKEGTESMIVTVDTYENGDTWIRGGKKYKKKVELKAPEGNIVDSVQVLLVNGAWLETLGTRNGSFKFDNKMTLPTDGMKIDGVQISSLDNEEPYENHKSLKSISLQCTQTLYRYKDTFDIPQTMKDSILRFTNTFELCVGTKKDTLTYMLVANLNLLKNKAFIIGDTVRLDRAMVEQLGLSAFADSLFVDQTVAVSSIQVIPEGLVSSFIHDMKVEIVEDRSTIPIMQKNGSSLWLWIAIGSVALIAVFVVLFLMKKKRDKKQRNEEKERREKEGEEQNSETEEKGKEVTPVTDSSESDKAVAKLKREFETERQKYADRIKSLEADKQKLTVSIATTRAELEGKVEAARKSITETFEKEIAKLKDDKKVLLDDLDREKKEGKNRVEAARKEEQEKSVKEIARLKDEKQKLATDMEIEKTEAKKRLEKAREEEKAAATRKIDELNAAHDAVVAQLKQEQKFYTDRIAIVPFASQYAQIIYSLINIVNDINVKAGELANADVDDPYMIFKAIGRFNMALSKIDYEKMLLDVSLAANDEMSFFDSGITSLKSVSQDQMFTSLRSYFLTSYLEKYINAAVVYNESLAGMDRLVSGLTPQQTAPFNAYREKLTECFKRLGIAVVSVKLFDKLGDNADLKARMVDFDESLPADTIIGIENCLVYPEGGRRPQEKIYVVAQK